MFSLQYDNLSKGPQQEPRMGNEGACRETDSVQSSGLKLSEGKSLGNVFGVVVLGFRV